MSLKSAKAGKAYGQDKVGFVHETFMLMAFAQTMNIFGLIKGTLHHMAVCNQAAVLSRIAFGQETRDNATCPQGFARNLAVEDPFARDCLASALVVGWCIGHSRLRLAQHQKRAYSVGIYGQPHAKPVTGSVVSNSFSALIGRSLIDSVAAMQALDSCGTCGDLVPVDLVSLASLDEQRFMQIFPPTRQVPIAPPVLVYSSRVPQPIPQGRSFRAVSVRHTERMAESVIWMSKGRWMGTTKDGVSKRLVRSTQSLLKSVLSAGDSTRLCLDGIHPQSAFS